MCLIIIYLCSIIRLYNYNFNSFRLSAYYNATSIQVPHWVPLGVGGGTVTTLFGTRNFQEHLLDNNNQSIHFMQNCKSQLSTPVQVIGQKSNINHLWKHFCPAKHWTFYEVVQCHQSIRLVSNQTNIICLFLILAPKYQTQNLQNIYHPLLVSQPVISKWNYNLPYLSGKIQEHFFQYQIIWHFLIRTSL